ncbi:hypothetical protein HAX54_044965 [Datura stramonium]|uniref:Uncharacterized protein n=1 Tax=Datura stramonium TaxID=4076 RepID=A0ABS8WK24_DATST|nr:hypothetical protein [Datura stramonium]
MMARNPLLLYQDIFQISMIFQKGFPRSERRISWQQLRDTGAGCPGIIRNRRCDMIMAFAFPINHGSNNRAKTRAAFIGIKQCVTNGFTDTTLKVTRCC